MGVADAGRRPTIARHLGPVVLGVVAMALAGAILGTVVAGRLVTQPDQILAAARSLVPATSTITETGENLGAAPIVGDYFAFTRFSDGGLGRDLLSVVQGVAAEGEWQLVSEEDTFGGKVLSYERGALEARVSVTINHPEVTGRARVQAISEGTRTDPIPAALWGATAGGLLGALLGFAGNRWRDHRAPMVESGQAHPTDVRGPYAVAPMWARVVAGLIDIVTVWTVVSAFAWLAIFAIAVGSNRGGSGVPFLIVAAIAVAAGLLYEPFFLSRAGMTLGRMVFRVHVVCNDGSLLSFTEASGRFALKLISILPLGIGFLVALRDQRRQTWYDRLSDSVVIRNVVRDDTAGEQRAPSPRDA